MRRITNDISKQKNIYQCKSTPQIQQSYGLSHTDPDQYDLAFSPFRFIFGVLPGRVTGATELFMAKTIRLFQETDFLIWFHNTGIMGVATALLQTVFILSMSYVLSRLRFKGRKMLMNIMLVLGMFPGFLTMILIYKVFSDLGLTMEMAPVGLILVYCASSGMGYYVSKGFFDTIPKSLDEAARVDGATRWQVFYKVIMPLSKPIIICTVLMGFMAPWGDFMMASYIIHENSAGMNVAVGVYEWLSKAMVNTNYTMFCAAGVVVAVPVTAVFLMLQKYYVEGVTGGAVKG